MKLLFYCIAYFISINHQDHVKYSDGLLMLVSLGFDLVSMVRMPRLWAIWNPLTLTRCTRRAWRNRGLNQTVSVLGRVTGSFSRFPVGPYLNRRRENCFRAQILATQRLHASYEFLCYKSHEYGDLPIKTSWRDGEQWIFAPR